MGKILKIFMAVAICVAGFALAGKVLENSDMELPVISNLLQSIHFDTGEKELNIDLEPFYEIEDTALFDETESILEDQAVSLSYAEEGFTCVSLQISQAALTVEMSEDTALYVETEEVSGYQAYVEDEVLYIIIEGTLSAQSAVQGESILPKAVISLPSDFTANEGALKLEILAGNAVMEDLEMKTLELTLHAGAVSLNDLSAAQLTVTMLAGSLTGQNLEVTASSSLIMSAGSMSLSGDLSTEVEISVTAGNLSLTLDQPYENYDCEITCAAGSVTVAGESYSGLTAAETVKNGGSNTLTIDCSVGVVEVEFSREEA